jgi:hypothetical protein
MSRLIEVFRTAWSALADPDRHASGWRSIRIDTLGSCELFAARRFPGNDEAMLMRFPNARLRSSERLPEGRGFEVIRTDPAGDGRTWIALSKKEAASSELFAEMVSDIANVMEASVGAGEESMLRALLRRVRMWQQFMSRGSGPLGPEEELGLVGELFFLCRLLDAGVDPDTLLKGWVGPNDAPQDFRLGCAAVEVKATLSSSGFPVKIGSLEQLADVVSSPLFLVAFRFATGESGITLPQLAAQLLRRLENNPESIDSLKGSLLQAGFAESHAGQYARRFLAKEEKVFEVSGSFPRLTGANVPTGVCSAAYLINLEHAEDFQCDFDAMLSASGVLQ